MSLATRTIIFDTKNHMGRNAGVLIAWICLSLITITSITLWQRRNHKRAVARESAGAGGVEAGNGGEKNVNGDESSRVREEEDEENKRGRPEDDHDRMVGYMRGEKTAEQRAEDDD